VVPSEAEILDLGQRRSSLSIVYIGMERVIGKLIRLANQVDAAGDVDFARKIDKLTEHLTYSEARWQRWSRVAGAETLIKLSDRRFRDAIDGIQMLNDLVKHANNLPSTRSELQKISGIWEFLNKPIIQNLGTTLNGVMQTLQEGVGQLQNVQFRNRLNGQLAQLATIANKTRQTLRPDGAPQGQAIIDCLRDWVSKGQDYTQLGAQLQNWRIFVRPYPEAVSRIQSDQPNGMASGGVQNPHLQNPALCEKFYEQAGPQVAEAFAKYVTERQDFEMTYKNFIRWAMTQPQYKQMRQLFHTFLQNYGVQSSIPAGMQFIRLTPDAFGFFKTWVNSAWEPMARGNAVKEWLTASPQMIPIFEQWFNQTTGQMRQPAQQPVIAQ
jgi:hypothetical protein